MASSGPSMPHGGGFLISPPASPAVSSPRSSSSSSAHARLPRPRASPLRPGGSKEGAFIRYVDAQLLHQQRRFAKRRPNEPAVATTDSPSAWDGAAGYRSMDEASADAARLVSVVWVSGTPSLQVPYLLALGTHIGAVVRELPLPSGQHPPRALFAVLRALDHAFASLLRGRDVETGERLPGFFGARGVSGTEKVRIRSLVERTRVGVVERFKSREFELDEVRVEEEREEEEERERHREEDVDMETDHEGELVLEGGDDEMTNDEDDGDEDDDNDDDDDDDDDDLDSWDMLIARVYDRTIVELGDSLEAPDIGIITEARN